MSEATAIVPAELGVVVPPLETKELVKRFNQIQELKRSLINDKEDVISIQGRPYIKKSGWRKLAFAFNLTDEVVREERTEKDGDIIWHIWVKVTAPNGRVTMNVAACSTRERKFSHPEHDVYALAVTRAKNRAISDILGLGEVSAEEVAAEEKEEEKSAEKTADSASPLLQQLSRELQWATSQGLAVVEEDTEYVYVKKKGNLKAEDFESVRDTCISHNSIFDAMGGYWKIPKVGS